MDLLVAADDRTGALETAAALADRGANAGAGVLVTVWPAVDPAGAVSVVDLESRHLRPDGAAERAARIPVRPVAGHKIDSTLRGNWAIEVAARHRASGQPVLIVPALPELGRVCVDGVVLLDGRPVGERGDVRLGTVSSRPIDHLAATGLEAVLLRSIDEVESWLTRGSGVAVADAQTSDDVDRIVAAWRAEPGTIRPSADGSDRRDGADGARHVLAGTSSVIACVIDASARASPIPAGNVLVVVGSANAVARGQVDELLASGFDPDLVLTTAAPSGIVAHDDAAAAGAMLLEAMHERLAQHEVDVIVVVGGDTAATVLGDDPVTVYGTAGAGTAWLRSPRYHQTIVTRAGGFGDPGALVALVSGTLRP